MAHFKVIKGKRVLVISDSDKDADWIKLIDGGKAREKDIAATEAALAKHNKEKGKPNA